MDKELLSSSLKTGLGVFVGLALYFILFPMFMEFLFPSEKPELKPEML